MDRKQTFFRGLTDGIPICLGYLSVSFAFGIFATEQGLTPWEAVLISMTCVTSAGQLAAVPIVAVVLSCLMACLPGLEALRGFSVILCAVIASAVAARL